MVEKNYKYIIWDWNGTIYDDAAFCVNIMNNLLSKRSLPLLSLEKYKEVFDFPVKDYYQKLGFDFNKEAFEIVGTEFINEYNNKHFSCKLHTGILELIKALNKKGYKQFVLSAREEKKLNEELKYYKIYSQFIAVAGLSDHYANGKIAVGKRLMERHEINPDDCLLIGDTLHDAEVAENLNIDCLLIANGHHSYEKLKQSNVTVLKSAEQLPKLFFLS